MPVHFSSETMGARKWSNNSKLLKEKEQSTRNPISSENILQEWQQNKDIPRRRKAKRNCHQQTYFKRNAEFFQAEGMKDHRGIWNLRNEEQQKCAAESHLGHR